jgi:hypothetical protein
MAGAGDVYPRTGEKGKSAGPETVPGGGPTTPVLAWLRGPRP